VSTGAANNGTSPLKLITAEGKVFVVMIMRAEDFRRLMPLFQDVTISVPEQG
jgi:hypothetical protein